MEVAAFVFLGWLLAVCFHEFGHAIVAYCGGDKSVKEKGYLTFNILKYTDPQMTFVFPLIILMLGGIALPGAAVYINRRNLRNRAWMSAVSAAGPFFSTLAGFIFAIPFLLGVNITSPTWLMPSLAFLVLLQLISVIYNSMPVPGFDGYGVIEPWLPAPLQKKAAQFGSLGIWLVFMAIWTVPGFNETIWGIAFVISSLLGVTPELIATGGREFMARRWWLAVGLVAAIVLSRRKAGNAGARSITDAASYYKDASALFKDNKIDDALSAANMALGANPKFPDAWYLRALCLGILNRNEEALPSFNAAIQLRPDQADWWYNRACCLALLGQEEASLDSLKHAMDLDPSANLKEHARKDVGFKSLHADPRFAQLTAD